MNTQSFPPWRQRLVRSLHLNRSQPQSRYYQVATVDGSGLPKNRTMVFRGFEDGNDNLLSITDRRSEKIIDWQKQENKNFELCWYFSKSREQYRVSGRAKLLFASDLPKYTAGESESSKLIKTWVELSQNAQQAFYLDTPKTPFCDNSEKADIQGSDSNKLSTNIKKTNINNAEVIRNISENFVLVSFIAESVDYLNLRATPHERLLSDKPQSWQERKVFA
ncbi:MAG: pyridoxamine 5'-phosphate oxidase family protein [Glaciecola sp.]|jgi:PPOX class probable FMN-dependent enzyme